VILSQISEHARVRRRGAGDRRPRHVEALDHIIAKAMAEAKVSFESLDSIAAAAGPGLIGGVIVGLTTAKAICARHDKPLMAVNHLEGACADRAAHRRNTFPYCLFLASGGHTQILGVRGVGELSAAWRHARRWIGEAFDKTAKLLGLGYPGGPLVEKEATRGDPARFAAAAAHDRPPRRRFLIVGAQDRVAARSAEDRAIERSGRPDLCASFQQAVVDVVKDRLRSGLRMFRLRVGTPTALVCAGGVAANQAIRKVAASRRLRKSARSWWRRRRRCAPITAP